MKVMIIGPESTGGRYVSRIVSLVPELEVKHWSMPHGARRIRRFWPTDENFDGWVPDLCLVTTRDWYPTVMSATKEHTNDLAVSMENFSLAYQKIMDYLQENEIKWRTVTYECLDNMDSIETIFDWIGCSVPDGIEPFIDGNVKWYQS